MRVAVDPKYAGKCLRDWAVLMAAADIEGDWAYSSYSNESEWRVAINNRSKHYIRVVAETV